MINYLSKLGSVAFLVVWIPIEFCSQNIYDYVNTAKITSLALDDEIAVLSQ